MVCDRLCNLFLQNKLLETEIDEHGEKIKRSRLSTSIKNAREGCEDDIAE